MAKFGREFVMYPISTEKISYETKLKMYGDDKYKVEGVSESVMALTKDTALTECIKAIKQLENGNSDYAVIELFSDDNGITRLNVCHMSAVLK